MVAQGNRTNGQQVATDGVIPIDAIGATGDL